MGCLPPFRRRNLSDLVCGGGLSSPWAYSARTHDSHRVRTSAGHSFAGGLLPSRTDSAKPMTIKARSTRLMADPGGVPALGIGRTWRISVLPRCSSKSSTSIRGTMARYRASAKIPNKEITRRENAKSANRDTTVYTPAGVKVSRGIPSAVLATVRPLRMEFRLMTTFMKMSRPNIHRASV